MSAEPPRPPAAPPPGRLLRAALAYAAHGWPVFPCIPGGKRPLTAHGFKDATTDAAVLGRWWRHAPRANIGLATGDPGPDVLDVDVRPGGDGRTALERLRRRGLLPSPSAVVATPSGGLHLYFRGTTRRGGSLRGHHLDLKAVGGYVVAPPSRIGRAGYTALSRGNPEPGVLDWRACRALLAPPRVPAPRPAPEASPPAAGLVRAVACARQGHRNSILFWAASRAAQERHPRPVLEALADASVKTGLSREEAERTIANALRYRPEH